MAGYKTVEDAFDCDRHRVETFGLASGFYSRYVLQNKVKKSLLSFKGWFSLATGSESES